MKWTTALLATAAISAAACSDGSITKPPEPPPPPATGPLVIRSERDTSLTEDTLRVGGNVWLRVTGVDTAAAVSWSVSDSAVAGLVEKRSARLRVNARKVGGAVVTASLNGQSGTFGLVIQQAPATNHPPVARVEGPSSAEEGKSVSFNAKASSDPDHDPLTSTWTFGDGPAKESGATVTHTYTDNGSRTVTVVVTDPGGLADTASLVVAVKNASPAISALEVPTAAVALSDSVKVTARVSDPGTDDVLTITFDWGDGKTSSGTDTHGAHLYAAAGTYSVKATVQDDDGDSASRSASVEVQQVDQGRAYDPVDLGTLGGNSAIGADLNNRGEIVGTSLTASGAEHAFLWDGNSMRDLGTLGHEGSEAVRINEAGVIAGTVWTRFTGTLDDNTLASNVGTIWQGGVGMLLDSTEGKLVAGIREPPGYRWMFQHPPRIVRAINGSGAVAWTSYDRWTTHGRLWRNDSWQQLPSYPMAMNDRGQVVGARAIGEDPALFQAFIAEGGSARDLGVLAPRVCAGAQDCSVSVAMDLNEGGQIVGVSTDAAGVYRFVLWENGQIKDLGSAGWASPQRAPRIFINNRGQIAASAAGHAFFWSGGAGSIVSLPSPGGSLEVAGLNENGEVAGTIFSGSQQHAFVWSQAGGVVDLGTGAQGLSAAWVVDINDRGDVMGYSASCESSGSFCIDRHGRNPDGLKAGTVRTILWRKK